MKLYERLQSVSFQVSARLVSGLNMKKGKPCTVCNKTVIYLEGHMAIHREEKPYNCEQCGKSFKRAGELKVHIRSHSGEKPFKCTHCDYSCSISGAMKEHIKIHTGVKPFMCKFCDYSCSRLDSLKKHHLTHTGSRPHNVLFVTIHVLQAVI